MIPLIINLPRSIERKLKIEEKLNRYFLSYKIIEGIDGVKLIEDEYRKRIAECLDIDCEKLKPSYFYDRKNFQSYGRDDDTIMKKVGCFLSHLLAIKQSIDNNLYNILILEDDFKINDNLFNLDISDCTGLITYLGGQGTGSIIAEPQSFIDLNGFNLYGTYGYLIKSREDMIYIYRLMMSCFNDGIGRTKLKDYKDYYLKDRLKLMSIDIWYKKFLHKKCVCAYPIIVEHDDEEISTIDTSVKYKKRYGLKCISKLENYSNFNIASDPDYPINS